MLLHLWTDAAKPLSRRFQAAVDGVISPEQAVKLRQCLLHIDELLAHKAAIEHEILAITEKYGATLDLLRTIPGFNNDPMTAISVLSEIGGDMSYFPTAKNLTSWAGCCPPAMTAAAVR